MHPTLIAYDENSKEEKQNIAANGEEMMTMSYQFCPMSFPFTVHFSHSRSSPSLSCGIPMVSFISLLFLPSINLVYPLNSQQNIFLEIHLLKNTDGLPSFSH